VHSLLALLPLQALAHASGFFRRSPRKLSLEAFVQSLLCSLGSSHYSLHHWAAQLSALQTTLFSKQALHRRCNQRLLDFLHLTLGAVLGHLSRADCPTEFLGLFKRVLLHDSTVLKLHPSLAEYFPGCGNQCATPMAGTRIQAIFDLCSQRWIHFQLGASKDSDQKDSALVLDYLQAGDLVIRDLGYAVLRVWRQIIGKGAYFLSRWRNDLKLFDPCTNQPVDLLALLKEHPNLCSLELLVGAQERLALRLVALRLPAQVAAQRRRRAKAKARRDRSLRPSERYLQLLDWSILGKALSPLKIAAYLCRLLPLITASPHRDWLEHFLYFCRYDSRRRPNFFQKIAALC
jgi:hypothetical protein